MYKLVSRMLAVMVLVLMIAVAAGCGNNNVVATVNGEKITKQQLDEMVAQMKQYYKAQGLDVDLNQDAGMMDTINSMTLDQLITQTLLVQEAKKMSIQVTSEDVDKEIAKYKQQMTEEKYNSFLKDNNISDTQIRSMIEKDLFITRLQDKLLEDVKPATEAQARDYYNKNKEEFVVPESYQVRHILVAVSDKETDKEKADLEARAKAQAIIEQLNQGKDFAGLAKEKSEDPGTASQGGLYTFSPGDAVPEFEAAAKALKPGEYTKEPVKTTYGYHIIKMEKVIPARQKSFDEVKQDIIDKLSDQAKQEKISKFVEEAKSKAQIVNYLKKDDAQKAGNESSKTP